MAWKPGGTVFRILIGLEDLPMLIKNAIKVAKITRMPLRMILRKKKSVLCFGYRLVSHWQRYRMP